MGCLGFLGRREELCLSLQKCESADCLGTHNVAEEHARAAREFLEELFNDSKYYDALIEKD